MEHIVNTKHQAYLNFQNDVVASVSKGHRTKCIEDTKHTLSCAVAIQVVCSICRTHPLLSHSRRQDIIASCHDE